jgi:hypothetical protein
MDVELHVTKKRKTRTASRIFVRKTTCKTSIRKTKNRMRGALN